VDTRPADCLQNLTEHGAPGASLPITGGCCCPVYVQCVRADRPITGRSGWPREKDLLTTLAEKRMAPPRRESLEQRLADVRLITRTFNENGGDL